MILWHIFLEKEMATHSSTLALKIPWTEELGAGYSPWGRKESGTTEWLQFFHDYLLQLFLAVANYSTMWMHLTVERFLGTCMLCYCCYYYNKEIKPVNPKGSQPWIFIGSTDAEAAILWPPDVKSQLIGKDPDAGKDGGQEEKGSTEDEIVGWHHWLDGYEFEQTPEDGKGQGSLACCNPWSRKELNMT